jgi:hypothetical protein
VVQVGRPGEARQAVRERAVTITAPPHPLSLLPSTLVHRLARQLAAPPHLVQPKGR